PKRSTDRCGIAAARSDQEIAVRQPEHKSVGCPVAIKISPENYVTRCVDCLHWIARERQAKALSAVDRIEKHDDFTPISRSSREPTGISIFWTRMVIGKEGNLSGVVDRRGLHVKVGPANGSRIRDLDVPLVDLAGTNDDAAFGNSSGHDS